jgi:hypothetical protein
MSATMRAKVIRAEAVSAYSHLSAQSLPSPLKRQKSKGLSEIDLAVGNKGRPNPKHFYLKMFWSWLRW